MGLQCRTVKSMAWETLDQSTVLIYKVKVIFELRAIFGPLYFEQEKKLIL